MRGDYNAVMPGRWLKRSVSVVTAISAVACAALLVLWLTNQLYRQEIIYGKPLDAAGARWTVDLAADMDGILVDLSREQRLDERYVAQVGWHCYAGEYPAHYGRWLTYNRTNWQLLGMAYGADQAWRQGYQHRGILVVQSRQRWLLIPYWMLVVLTAILPVGWICRQSITRARERRHQCVVCGYDLRATPEAEGPMFDRCPECGSEVHVTAKPQKTPSD